jgi:hypothetical protein
MIDPSALLAHASAMNGARHVGDISSTYMLYKNLVQNTSQKYNLAI